MFQMLFYIFAMVFDFWPVLLLAPIRNRRNGIRNMVYVWGFWGNHPNNPVLQS